MHFKGAFFIHLGFLLKTTSGLYSRTPFLLFEIEVTFNGFAPDFASQKTSLLTNI